MKILFFETNKQSQTYFTEYLSSHDLKFIDCELTPTNCPQQSDAEIVSVFVCSYITEAVLEQFPKLKLIVTRSTGFDHIDIQAAKKHGITVCNAPAYATITVAEYTFALILTLSRKIYRSYHRVKEEHSFSLEHLTGFDLAGKTLGIIGTGQIGRHVIQRARAFEMNVLAYDISPQNDLAKQLGFTYIDYTTILQQSDIISYHVQLTPETFHMLNSKNINSLKTGAYIINTARGQIIETQALINGLQKGRIAGAALDVLEEECFFKDRLSLFINAAETDSQKQIAPANQYLINHPNVIVTPHNAFNTHESQARLISSTVETIRAWIEKKPINTVF